jgi:transposase-like protein
LHHGLLGMRERGGRTKAMIVEGVDRLTLLSAVTENVEPGSTIHTDEFQGYDGLGMLDYDHRTINHKLKQYVHNGVGTNSLESVWAVMKRGLHGVYHHASRKHLGRYVNEFTWRLNDGNVERHTLDRLDSFVDAVAGRRLTYKRLTA